MWLILGITAIFAGIFLPGLILGLALAVLGVWAFVKIPGIWTRLAVGGGLVIVGLGQLIGWWNLIP